MDRWSLNKLPGDDFEWIESTNFTDYFIKNYDKYSDVRCILEVDINYSEPLGMSQNDLSLLFEKIKWINKINLLSSWITKKNMLYM